MILVRKAKEHAVHATHLQYIECGQSLCDGKSVVEFVVDDAATLSDLPWPKFLDMELQLRRAPVLRSSAGIPLVVLILALPNSSLQIVYYEVLLIWMLY